MSQTCFAPCARHGLRAKNMQRRHQKSCHSRKLAEPAQEPYVRRLNSSTLKHRYGSRATVTASVTAPVTAHYMSRVKEHTRIPSEVKKI